MHALHRALHSCSLLSYYVNTKSTNIGSHSTPKMAIAEAIWGRPAIAKIMVRDSVRVKVFRGSFRVQQLWLLPVVVIAFGTAVYRIA